MVILQSAEYDFKYERAWNNKKGALIIKNRKYIAEDERERYILMSLFYKRKFTCNDVEAIIGLVFEVH